MPRIGQQALSALLVACLATLPCCGLPKTSARLGGHKGFMPERLPDNPDELIKTVEKYHPGTFDSAYLQETAAYFSKRWKEEFGKTREMDSAVFAMFQQWLYLDAYRVKKLEYLLYAFSKSVILKPEMTVKSARALMERYFPDRVFRHYPNLKKNYESLIAQIEEHFRDPSKKKKLEEHLRGTIEAAYMSIALVHAKRRYLEQRFTPSDQAYIDGMTQLEGWERMIRNSQSILSTDAFKFQVEGRNAIHLAELIPAHEMKEAQVNEFLERFYDYIEQERSVEEVIDYLSGEEIRELGVGIAGALNLRTQVIFRGRIEQAFPDGAQEIALNQAAAISEFSNESLTLDTAPSVYRYYTSPNLEAQEFPTWLLGIFKEQVLHWFITEEYPYLRRAAESLTSYAKQQLSKEARSRSLRYTSLALMLALSPLGKPGNAYSSWLGRGVIQAGRVGWIGTGAALSGTLFYDAYKKYHQWKNIGRLLKLNLEGSGLTNLIQEENAYWSMMVNFGFAGFSAGMIALTGRGFYQKEGAANGFVQWNKEVAKATWGGEPVKGLATELKASMRALWQASREVAPGKMARAAGSLGLWGSSLITQFVVMIPAALPQAVKTFLGSLPPTIYNAVALGTVMGVMAVTVQTYITAASLGLFTDAFATLGFTPPNFWKMNALNAAHRFKRDMLNVAVGELLAARIEITKLTGMIVMWRRLLADPEVSDEEKSTLSSAIASARRAIDNILRLQIVRWYLRKEIRDLALTAMTDQGFGFIPDPPKDNPPRMTIIFDVGSERLAYQMRADQIDLLMESGGNADLGLTQEEIEEVLRRLAPNDQINEANEDVSGK